MIRGLIFDLDMCIFNTFAIRGNVIAPVLEALEEALVTVEVKQLAAQALKTTSLEDVIAAFSIPEESAHRMREAYRDLEAPDGLETFGDEGYIADLPEVKYLVTSGYIRFQQSKIDKLGIAPLFKETIIDAIDDPVTHKGKTKIFEELLDRHGWAPHEVLVIGDNPISEIRAAEELGIPTVQTLRPGIHRYDGATHHVTSLSELASIIASYEE